MARRLQLPSGQTGAVITDVDPERTVGAALLRRATSSCRSTASRCRTRPKPDASCRRSQSGRLAQILVWRGDGEVFVTVKKD